MKINYFTTVPENEISGGVSGVNHAVFPRMKNSAECNYCYIAPPPIAKTEMLRSKFLKCLHLPRNYFAFSEKRLALFARNAAEMQFPAAEVNFFNGFTQWVAFDSKLPYFAYNDASFWQYVRIYNRRERFLREDLQRIYDAERRWMSNAAGVFFRSRWAAEETRKAYHLSGDNFYPVGRGGSLDIPARDIYAGETKLLFCSREFIPKGGARAVQALRLIREKYPDVILQVIGEKPPAEFLSEVDYLGFLNKRDPDDLKKMRDAFSTAMFLLHPTEKDTNPLVITEAGYFGCPAIAPDSFAIPELIQHDVTGFLAREPEEIARRVIFMLEHREEYLAMRVAARRFCVSDHHWDIVVQKMLRVMYEKAVRA